MYTHAMPINRSTTDPTPPDPTSDLPFLTVTRRGLARRCPNCGEGATLTGYLTQVPACASCGLDFSEIRADDGPA